MSCGRASVSMVLAVFRNRAAALRTLTSPHDGREGSALPSSLPSGFHLPYLRLSTPVGSGQPALPPPCSTHQLPLQFTGGILPQALS